MRTTLAIDDDVLAAVKNLAAREHKSIGQTISILARQRLAQDTRNLVRIRNGVLLLETRDSAAAVTPELINQFGY